MKQNPASDRIMRLLFWETTIKCNLSCAHCRRIEDDQAAITDLSTEQGMDLIDQLAEAGRSQPMMPVLVFSGGEPLCRDDLFELVAHAREKGLIPALASNGTLIDSAVAAKIKASGIARVSISLDGATAEIHNKLRQSEGSFEGTLDGIKHLCENDVPFQVNITLTKHNAHQLRQTYDLAKSLGAVALHIFMLVPVGCGQTLAETDMLSPQQYERMLVEICSLDKLAELQVKVTCGPHYQRVIRQQGLYEARHEVPGAPHQVAEGPGGGGKGHNAEPTLMGQLWVARPVARPSWPCVTRASSPGLIQKPPETDALYPVPGRSSHGSSKGCLAGLGVLFVSHQGDVFPCGYLPVNCGNILKTKLSDIWQNSKDLARMRDADSLEGKCGLCGYRHLCGGCRARAYAATGNYMAEEPFCAYIPPQAIS